MFFSGAIVTHAPAKLNLLLELLDRRPDGYHEIRSLACGAGLFDEVGLRQPQGTAGDVFCDNPELMTPDNLAVRAMRRVREGLGAAGPCQVVLRKNIPIAGGMGGGSSDAASALMLANQWFGSNWTDERLASVGAELGSDVPLFFHLPTALVSGRGENVSPAAMRWSGWAVLVRAGIPVSTREAYAAVRDREIAASPPTDVQDILGARSASALSDLLRNDLEPAVFRVAPRVQEARAFLRERGFGLFRVTGAGSVLFRLFDLEEEAASVSTSIERCGVFAPCLTVRVPVGRQPIMRQEN